MAHKVPFLVAELGPDVDSLVLHLFAALAEKERALISTRTRQALSAATARGVTLATQGSTWPARKRWHSATVQPANGTITWRGFEPCQLRPRHCDGADKHDRVWG